MLKIAKLAITSLLATLCLCGPVSAQSCDSEMQERDCEIQEQEENNVAANPWADTPSHVAQSIPAIRVAATKVEGRTSRRTNTNLSNRLPATVTCSVNLSILSDRDYRTDTQEMEMPQPVAQVRIIPNKYIPALGTGMKRGYGTDKY